MSLSGGCRFTHYSNVVSWKAYCVPGTVSLTLLFLKTSAVVCDGQMKTGSQWRVWYSRGVSG